MSDGSPDTAAPPNSPPRLALRPAEAAKALGIGRRLLWSETNAGRIPCVRIGKAVLYPVSVLETYLAEEAAKGREGKR